jgi:ketosteroid isomerase-like protein
MRTNTRLVLTVFALVALSAAITFAQPGDARAAIEAANKQFSAAFAKGDAAALSAMYTSSAIAFPPNGEIARGQTAIQSIWKGAIASGLKGLVLTTAEVETHGDTAHEVGNYEMRDAGGKAADRGKYIVIWKREGGQWKLHRDIWNSNMPAGK